MKVALVQVCVDERLNHELLRIQIKHRLAELYLQARQIMIVNEIGGNLGANFRNTTRLVLNAGKTVVFAAVLHHDDCQAAKAGIRWPLEESITQMTTFLDEQDASCALSAGNIYTNNNHIIWPEELPTTNQQT